MPAEENSGLCTSVSQKELNKQGLKWSKPKKSLKTVNNKLFQMNRNSDVFWNHPLALCKDKTRQNTSSLTPNQYHFISEEARQKQALKFCCCDIEWNTVGSDKLKELILYRRWFGQPYEQLWHSWKVGQVLWCWSGASPGCHPFNGIYSQVLLLLL